MRRIVLLIFVLISSSSLNALVRDIVESIKTITVRSVSQKVLNYNTVVFEGGVEVEIDHHLHVWADYVEVDKADQLLCATADPGSFVTLEGEGFFVRAQRIEVKCNDRTVKAEGVYAQFDGIYIRAALAEKLSEDDWHFKDVVYSACDHPSPHWSLHAGDIQLNKYAVRLRRMSMWIGKIPIFALPGFAVPAQSHSRSGFLVPKFSWSRKFGFGINQAFYLDVHKNVDTTFGVHWKQKQGFNFYNELRVGQHEESYTILTTRYAREKNAFIEKNDEIIKGRHQRLWINGLHFQSMHIGAVDVHHLVHLDFGTDKQIDYDFSSIPEVIEDRFYNTWIARWATWRNQVAWTIESDRFFREQFTFPPQQQAGASLRRETEDKFELTYAPRLDWHTTFHRLTRFLHYRHYAFVDRECFHRRIREKTYENNRVVQRAESNPLLNEGTVRLYYEGDLETLIKWGDHRIRFNVQPNAQFRSQRKNDNQLARWPALETAVSIEGAARLFVKTSAEWALPEYWFHTADFGYQHYMQGVLRWDFVPKFQQDHWFHADEWDREFAKNAVEATLRNNWYINSVSADLSLSLAYEFYPRGDTFPLFRTVSHQHLLPFTIACGFDWHNIHVDARQSYDVDRGTLVESLFNVVWSVRDFSMYVGLVYQHPRLQRLREVFSDIPSFFLWGAEAPLGKRFKFFYASEFYSDLGSPLGLLKHPKLLVHRFRFDYTGHCWGFAVGYEEKKNRQQGEMRIERSVLFSVKFDSFGSFSKRFKAYPEIERAPVA